MPTTLNHCCTWQCNAVASKFHHLDIEEGNGISVSEELSCKKVHLPGPDLPLIP